MGFIGFSDQYEKYKQEKDTLTTVGTGNRISYDDISNISSEDMMILRENHTRHDPYTVFMQADESFYHGFYDTSDEQIENKEDPYISAQLLADAKSIRKVHSRYSKYERDMKIREAYMDALADKYGGYDRLEWLISIGGINEYIPNMPIFARSSDEYDLYLQGGPSIEIGNDLSDQEIRELIGRIAQSRGVDVNNVDITGDVITSFVQRNHSELTGHTGSGIRRVYNNSIGTADYSDMYELQQLFRSWYVDDSKDSKKDNSDEQKNYFCDTPKELKRRYYSQKICGNEGVLMSIMDGTYVEPDKEFDPNEMVVDSSTGKAMTRAELDKRNWLKILTECGFDELKLMRHLGIGSRYEINMKKEELRRRRRGKKKAKSLVGDILGDNYIETASSIEDLENYLFSD